MKIKTYDFDFVKKEQEKVIEDIKTKRLELLPQEDSVLTEYPYQLKYHTINSFFNKSGMNMESMLNDLGYDTRGDSNMYCPFHDDEHGGKPSAKYHPESDTVYCFSESKLFTSFHVIKDLMGKNTDVVFRRVWNDLLEEEREGLLTKYGEGTPLDTKENISKTWKDLTPVLEQFKLKKVSFNQHKIALYKILHQLYDERAQTYKKEEFPTV